MISAERLHTFAVFAEDPNLSRTAKRLGLSQPAVHAQLKQLGDDLGVALYERQGRGLVLTRDGLEVLAFAKENEDRAGELRARLRGDAAPAVVLAAGAGALVHLLAPGLRAFSKRKVRVEVLTADAAQAVQLVTRGQAHVGVGVLDLPPPTLETTTLATAAQVAVLPHGHRLAGKKSVTLADLAGEPLVFPPEGGPQRVALDAAFARAGLAPHPVAIARGWDVVLRLVEIGIGIGIVNDTCVLSRSLEARRVRELAPVRYFAFTRPKPRAEAAALIAALA